MKSLIGAMFALALTALSLSAATVCPVTGNTNTDCGYLLTIGPGGAVSGAPVKGANPYDGSDDALVGVTNNSGSIYNGSITLIGSGNGGGIFAFDGDGICTFTRDAYCATAATGYEGPNNTFTGIKTTSVFDDTGTVVFSGLGIGASTYFSLESSPSTIGSGGGPVIIAGTGTPEPSTISMLGAGLLAFVTVCRKLKKSV